MTVESASPRSEPRASITATLRASVHETAGSVAAVFRNPALRRLELALATSLVGDWAYAMAVAVWAYGVGGVQAVGVWGAIRYVGRALAAPLGSVLADRLPRRAVLISADLLRAAMVGGAAAVILVGGPTWPVFVLATLAFLVAGAFTPAQHALLPSLTNRPEELTSANATSSTLESLAFFVGPMLGAALMAALNVETVFFLNAATFLFSAVMVLGIRPLVPDVPAPRSGDEPRPGVLGEMGAGFTAIGRHPDLRVIAFLTFMQTLVAGAMGVFGVRLAVDVLRTGPAGIGYLESAFGVGAILGGFFALARVARNRLANDLAVGTVVWSAPLLLVVVWPTPVTAIGSSIVMGFGNPMVDVSFISIVQRITPDHVLGRVFGALEGGIIGGMAVGSAVMPFLIDGVGLRPALALLALVVAVPAAALLPRCARLDATLRPPAELPWLVAIPMFAPLRRDVLESLATRLTVETAPAGAAVLREGEESDRFLIITSGLVEVTQGTRVLRTEGPGEFVGEIGLLRDVPRTATVTAVEDSQFLVLSRADFLDAVGSGESRILAEDVVTRRLA